MNGFDKSRVRKLLSGITLERFTGASGLAVLSAASLLAFAQSPSSDLITTLVGYISGLGLDVFAGVLQNNYQDLLSQPTTDEQERLSELTQSIAKDIKREAKLRQEIGSFLGNIDAFQIAEEVTRGNVAVHGWLLVELYKDVSHYRDDFDHIHVALEEISQAIQKLARNPSFIEQKSNILESNDISFKHEIADLYRAMGFEIYENEVVAGQFVNILATRQIPGSSLYKLVVECLYRNGNTLIDKEEVQSVFGLYNAAKITDKILACTIITTNGFTLGAKNIAAELGINLITKKELVASLIDFSIYLRKLKMHYEVDFGKGDTSWYISTRGRLGNENIDALDDYIDTWLTIKDHRPLALLGGYGTGKTTFGRHYAVRLASSVENPIPIFIHLRNFRKILKIESLIRDFLDEECELPSPRFDTFWRMYSEGLLLIIFDGFDEMATSVSASVLEANLIEIEKFTYQIGNVILTCRPEFFISKKEEQMALKLQEDPLSERMAIYQPINIELWEPEQISRYVEKRIQGMQPPPFHPPAYYIDRIRNLPELQDMSSRAVHLDLIVRMLPKMLEQEIPINRPNLFNTYIQQELRRETVRNRYLVGLSDYDRLTLMRTIASERFLSSHDELDFEVASRFIQDKLNLPKSEVESVTRDFLNRSFLERNGDIYRFAHKSLGEYLLASEVYEQIKEGNLAILEKTNYTAAVTGMVLEMFGGIDALDAMLESLNIQRNKLDYSYQDIPRIIFATYSLMDYVDGARFLWRIGSSPDKNILYTQNWIAGLTHDLNNRLGLIKVYRDRLSDKHKEDVSDKDYTSRIVDAWKGSLSRLDDLKRFHYNRLSYKIEVKLNRVMIDLHALLENFNDNDYSSQDATN